jgi:hypothetical protein
MTDQANIYTHTHTQLHTRTTPNPYLYAVFKRLDAGNLGEIPMKFGYYATRRVAWANK